MSVAVSFVVLGREREEREKERERERERERSALRDERSECLLVSSREQRTREKKKKKKKKKKEKRERKEERFVSKERNDARASGKVGKEKVRV